MHGGRPPVEGTGCIVLALDRLLHGAGSGPGFTAIMQGHAGSTFCIVLNVTLGPGDKGSIGIRHADFRHLSQPVPAAFYSVELKAVPRHFGGRQWYIQCPHTGASTGA